jgi:hypothetical protein
MMFFSKYSSQAQYSSTVVVDVSNDGSGLVVVTVVRVPTVTPLADQLAAAELAPAADAAFAASAASAAALLSAKASS